MALALTVGGVFTVKLIVALPVHAPVVPITVYVVFTEGLAVTLLPVVAERPVPGLHV